MPRIRPSTRQQVEADRPVRCRSTPPVGRPAGGHRPDPALDLAVRCRRSEPICRPRPRPMSRAAAERARVAQAGLGAGAASRTGPRCCSASTIGCWTGCEEFADLVQYDAGKARLTAVEEVLHVALSARYCAVTAERYLRTARGIGPVAGADPDRPALPAQGPGRRHRALELPADHGRLGRAGGPGGRQRGAPQAGRCRPRSAPWRPSICCASADCRTISGRSSTARGPRSARR